MPSKDSPLAYIGTDPTKQRATYGGLPSVGSHSTPFISDDSDFMKDEGKRVVGNLAPDLRSETFARDVVRQQDEKNFRARQKSPLSDIGKGR